MSTGVSDQRMKGQGNQANGPKDHVGEQEDLESWRSAHLQQGYSSQISTTLPSDPYMTNYYNTSFAPGYPPYGVGEASWSNGGDPIGFLGGYATGDMGHGSYIDGMFGGSGAANFSAPNASYSFNYYGNGDYSTWGSNASMGRKPQYEEYYRDGVYSPHDNVLKDLEHGVQTMGLGPKLDQRLEKESKEPKKLTWASVASQPAKPQPMLLSSGMKKKGPGMPPPPMIPGKHLDIGMWESRNGGAVVKPPPVAAPPAPQVVRPAWTGPSVVRHPPPPLPQQHQQQQQQQQQPPQHHPHHHQHHHQQQHQQQQQQQQPPPPLPAVALVPVPPQNHPVLDELRVKNNYNPPEFDMTCKGARFFVIKSYSEDDIHRSIKYEIWCSTDHGNKRLDQAFRETDPTGPIYLFFSVNGSGHFCGMAQMVTAVDYHASSSVWSQDKWKGQFRVRWIYVKDVPNTQLRHIRLENNENKPVTNSRDTQEVPFEKGRQVLRVMHVYRHNTSIFDDFFHYEKRQEEEEDHKRVPEEREPPPPPPPSSSSFQHKERNDSGSRDNREHSRPHRGGRSGHRN